MTDIDLNLKDSKDVYAKLYENMATRFRTSNYRKLHRLYNEAVGQTPCMKGTRKTWVVDVDTKDRKFVDEVRGFILTLFGGCGYRLNSGYDYSADPYDPYSNYYSDYYGGSSGQPSGTTTPQQNTRGFGSINS